MIKSKIKLLKKLISTLSPSGFEDRIAKVLKSELLSILPRTRVEVDFHKNVIAKIPGTSDKTIVIDAHLDQIGFSVVNVDREGFITLGYLGGGDVSILSARPLTIMTDKGDINAVINRKHAHLVKTEEAENIEDIEEAQVDIGLRKRKQVLRKLKIGDPIVYKPNFYELAENYCAGYGFDDKAGCFVLLETIKEIVKSKKKPYANLVFVFSSQEETGTRLNNIVQQYQPDLVMSVDVTFATDYLWTEELEREAGRCELGKGVVIYRGLNIHLPTVKLLENIARKYKAKFQTQANLDAEGFTSLITSSYTKGFRSVVLGIPLRNMHTPVETIHLKDLDYSVLLLKNFLITPNLKNVLDK